MSARASTLSHSERPVVRVPGTRLADRALYRAAESLVTWTERATGRLSP